MENGLRLTTVSGLLAVVTTLTLRKSRGFARLVLGDLVQSVLAALAALAEGLSGLGDVDHFDGCLLAMVVVVLWVVGVEDFRSVSLLRGQRTLSILAAILQISAWFGPRVCVRVCEGRVKFEPLRHTTKALLFGGMWPRFG